MAAIFLSYARSDDEPFTRRLHEYLTGNGFTVWWDRVSMPSRALTFLQEIRDAIHGAERVIVVVGPNGVSSDYVRAEWQHALAEGKVVVPVLRLGTRADVPAELKRLHCPDCRTSRAEAESFAEIGRLLRDPIPPLATMLGDLPDVPAHFQPRPAEMTSLAAEVFRDLESPVSIVGPQRTIVLYGMGGVGKSVVAAAFARSTTARRVFSDGVVWLTAGPDVEWIQVSRQFDRLFAGAPQTYTTPADAAIELRRRLQGRRLLVVVDNVWRIEQIEPLLGSIDVNTRLLVTSRDGGLVTAIGSRAIEITELSNDAALRHLADWVNQSVDQLPPAAIELARECGYLPLALALNGAMLASGTPWEDLLAALRSAELDFAEQRFANYPYPNVLRSIKASVDALAAADSLALARYSELAAFDWLMGVPEQAVSTLWQHTAGIADRESRKLLQTLAAKALVRLSGKAPERTVLLHDLLADYLRATARDLTALNATLLEAYRDRCSGDWSTGPHDGYFHEHLVEHLVRAGRPEEVHELLALEARGTNAWYSANDAIGNIDGYLADVRRAAQLDQTQDPDDRDALGRQLRWQLHYALIAASVRSLASTLPDSMRSALVRAGVWTAARALAEASQVAEPRDRVNALVDVMPLLDEPLRRRAIDYALRAAREELENERPALLASVVPFVSTAERSAVIDEARALTDTIDSPGDRAGGLASLLPHVSDEQHEALLDAAVRAITEEIETAGINQSGFGAADAIARHLPRHELPRFLETVRRIPNTLERVRVLEWIADGIGPPVSAAIAREGLELLTQVEDDTLALRIAFLRHLGECSDDALYDQVVRLDPGHAAYLLHLTRDELTPPAAEAWLERLARTPFEWEIFRISAYADLLPRLSPERRTAIVGELLVELSRLEIDWRVKRVYGQLAPYLSADQLRAVRVHLSTVGDAGEIGSPLVKLMPYLDGSERGLVCDFLMERVNAEKYLDVLVQLAEGLNGADRERVIATASAALQKGARMGGGTTVGTVVEETLVRLAQMAPSEALRLEALGQAFESIVNTRSSADLKAHGLAVIARELKPDSLDREIRRLLEAAEHETVHSVSKGIDGDHHGDRAVVANTIETLAPYMSENVRAEAIAVARRVADPGWQMAALAHLAPFLAEPDRSSLIEEAVALRETLPLEGTEPSESYWRPLVALADCLSGVAKQSVLSQAIAAASHLDDWWRPEAFMHIAQRLDDENKAAVLIDIAPLIPSSQAHEVVSALPPSLAGELLDSAILTGVRDATADGDNARTYVSMATRHSQLAVWQQARDIAVELSRVDLVKCLPGLAPLLDSLGGPGIVPQVVRSVMRTVRWWP